MAIAALILILTMTFALFFFIFWVYNLIDAIRSDFDPKEMKLIWILMMIFVPVIGTMLYIIVGKQQRLMPLEEEFV